MNKLIIPVQVEAFLSNGKPSEHKMFPVNSPDYRHVSYTSMLGSKNTPAPFNKTSVLQAGVHLHFILPDAFTHRDEEYLTVPNRFVVTRMYSDRDKNKIHSKCFIVESDFMSMDKIYSGSITIPRFDETNPRKNWRYMGRSYSADNIPAKTGNEEYLERLTAIGAGDPVFASYYPSCSSVFGFYDNMDGVPLNSSVTYFVTGYYDNPGNNPFSHAETSKDFRETLDSMRLFTDIDAPVCDNCVLFGIVSNIVWKGDEEDYPFTPQGEINVSAGNTSAEALSAGISRFVAETPMQERFLTALQYGLADSGFLSDGNYKIDDEIHLHQFQRLDANETKYEFSIYENPPALGDKFSAYCTAKKEFYRLGRRLEYLRTKLFHTWEQYMLCYENPKFTPKNIPSESEMQQEILKICREEIRRVSDEIADKDNGIKKLKAELDKAVNGFAEIKETSPETFYLPKDPVLLLSGPGIKRSYAFGEDGRFSSNNAVYCQTEIIKANVTRQDVFKYLNTALVADALPDMYKDLYEDLLFQAVLLSADTLPVIEKNIAEVSLAGQIPSKLAGNIYHSEGITLFLDWETEYSPVGSGSRPDDTLTDWKYNADEVSYHYEGSLSPAQIKTKLYFSGRTILTPHAVINLSDALKKWLETHSDNTEVAALAEKIKDLGVISQNLDGFTMGFSALKQAYQFPVTGIGGDDELVMAVATDISRESASIDPDGPVHPMRGGYLKINRLSLTGTFGQVQNFTDTSYFGEKEICFAETMKNGLLPPAFTAPVRLNVDFVSAASDSIISSAAPETSPIFGIVLPEMLNRRIMIYQSDGSFAGSVNTAYRQGFPCTRWVSAQNPEQEFNAGIFNDNRLYLFVKSLLSVDGALTDMLRIAENYMSNKLIPAANCVVWGRPFVLARCKMDFEYRTAPEFTKNYTSFGKYDTLSAENISFPVMFGGIERATDGVLGCFSDDYGFDGINPAFGTDIKPSGSYVLPQNKFEISHAVGTKFFTLMMEPNAPAVIQTGLMPVKSISIHAVHAALADNIFMAAEMNPVITAENDIKLPINGYSWKYYSGEEYIQNKITPPTADFAETVVMDGFIVKETTDV